jgi:hypothetical protein
MRLLKKMLTYYRGLSLGYVDTLRHTSQGYVDTFLGYVKDTLHFFDFLIIRSEGYVGYVKCPKLLRAVLKLLCKCSRVLIRAKMSFAMYLMYPMYPNYIYLKARHVRMAKFFEKWPRRPTYPAGHFTYPNVSFSSTRKPYNCRNDAVQSIIPICDIFKGGKND